jgi:hypothetical protein
LVYCVGTRNPIIEYNYFHTHKARAGLRNYFSRRVVWFCVRVRGRHLVGSVCLRARFFRVVQQLLIDLRDVGGLFRRAAATERGARMHRGAPFTAVLLCGNSSHCNCKHTSQAAEQLHAIDRVQQRRALVRLNAIADSCFDVCVSDMFGTKHLRPGEEECLKQCVDKYLLLSKSVGVAFSDALPSTSG